jgi:putative ABC transport system permease protein
VLPLKELQELMLRRGSVTGFSVRLDSTPDKQQVMDAVRARIESLTDDEGNQYRISARPTKEYVSNAMPVKLARGMAWVTSLLAVLIGGISMLNTMIMSVMERTKEIGVLRAIGWKTRRVVCMVMGEALLLSLAATAIGTAAAWLVMRWLAHLPQTSNFMTGELAPVVLLEGLAMTLVVALCGGVYPAYRAARWMPSEALRHE